MNCPTHDNSGQKFQPNRARRFAAGGHPNKWFMRVIADRGAISQALPRAGHPERARRRRASQTYGNLSQARQYARAARWSCRTDPCAISLKVWASFHGHARARCELGGASARFVTLSDLQRRAHKRKQAPRLLIQLPAHFKANT